jgi:hypothetical protein
MSSDPIGSDVRKQRRGRRIGVDAACAICGETNPDALTRVPQVLLERHHVAGRANDGALTVVVCLNHHAKLGEAQRDSGVELNLDPARPPVRRTVALLRGLADFAEQLVPSLRGHADALDAHENNNHEKSKEER